MKLKVAVIFSVIFAACFLFNACNEINDAKKADDAKAEIGEITLSPASMALFLDGGEKAISIEIAEHTAELFTVDWTSDNPEIAEVRWDGETAVVYPKGQGNAVITAKLKPKQEGYKPDFELPEAVCPITVLSEFKLDSQRLLFFEGESSQTLTAMLPQTVFEVAEIKWSVETSRNDSITVSGTGASATVSAAATETFGIITAQLEAKDAAAFNGSGKMAVCVVTVLEAPSIEAAPAEYMLGPNASLKRALYTARYSPGRIDFYHPVVNWTSSNPNKVDFEGEGSVGLGRATTYLIAKEEGEAEITAELTVAERTFSAAARINVGAYIAPNVAVSSVTIDKKPSILIKTDTTSLITATAAADSGTPSDLYIEWGVSELGVVELLDGENSANNSGKHLRGVWQGEEVKQVTVTAKSRSNPDVLDFFNIIVSPLIITVVPASGSSTNFTSGQTTTLHAAVNASNNRNIQEWTSNYPELVTISSSGQHNEIAVVSMNQGASVTDSSVVEITAFAAADYGVSSGVLNITINPHSFSILYNKNDGSTPAVTQTAGPFVYGDGTENLASQKTLGWMMEDRTFKGWADSADGTVAYRNEAPLTALNSHPQAQTPGGTVTLYAHWRINNPTVSEMDKDDFGPNADITVFEVAGAFGQQLEGQVTWAEAVEAVKNGPAGNYLINFTSSARGTAVLTLTDSSGPQKKVVSLRRHPQADPTTAFTASAEKILNISGNNHVIIRNLLIYSINDPFNTSPDAAMIVRDGAVLEFKKDAEIDNGFFLSCILVENGGKVIMRDNAIISKGDPNLEAQNGAVNIKAGGVFEMYDTSSLTDNKHSTRVAGPSLNLYSGAVYLEGGTFTMNDDSSITNNFMVAGSFSGDRANVRMYGPGVFLNSGTFIMNDNAVIAGSQAGFSSSDRSTSILYGGGLYIEAPYTNSVFIKNGGTIYGNELETPEHLRNKSDHGAAVYLDDTYKRDTTITPAQRLRFENGIWTNWIGD